MEKKIAAKTMSSRIPSRCARSICFFILYESSGARHRHPRCETASIFPTDRGSVKLRFRRYVAAALNFRLRTNLTRSKDPHTLATPHMKALHYASIAEIRERVRTKKLSPVEVVAAYLERIEALQPKLNAFVHIDADAARAQACRAEDAVWRGGASGPLLGVPITLKSCIDVAGWPCPAGSLLRKDYVAEADATLAARLRAAGSILLGNTNTPEFLMAYETDNLIGGKTSNPWDLSRSAGGSSGEAAAIASGCSASGLGSDGGGSIRVPAHFTGICGLKPTPGRIPATGHFPVCAGPFASIGVVGPMARTVADLRVLFEVMQGPDVGDTSAAPVPLRWPTEGETRNLRIGYFEDDGRTPVTAETRAAVRTAAEALSSAGFQVERFRPEGLEEARQLWWKYFVVAGGMLLRPMFKGRESDLSPILRSFLELASSEPAFTADTLLDAWIQRDSLRTRFFAQMQQYPILLCPAAAIPAFRHGERSWQVEGKTVHYLDAWSYTEFFNLLGNPAAVVPVSHSVEGLPIGVQIIGRPWEAEQVLSVASALETLCGTWTIPPIAGQRC